MPYCKVGRSRADTIVDSTTNGLKDEETISIFYKRYGHGPIKVLFIIGLAGTYESWAPQVVGLSGIKFSHEEEGIESRKWGRGDDCSGSQELESKDGSKTYSMDDNRSSEYESTRESSGNGIEVCAFDNRGVGNSSIPKQKSAYSTQVMAKDALALLDHLGWEKAHVCGHSMGGMIACKLAAMEPHRLSSLTLIGVTGGGYQCLPKFNRKSISLAYRLYRAKTAEERAAVDLETHYTKDYLESVVGETNRRVLLFKEYVKNLLQGGMQPRYGLEGQVFACWNHGLRAEELEAIRSAGVIVAVVHGRGDVIAQVEHARTLAKKLHPVSRMIELSGGHLVINQNTDEVNRILLGVIRAVSMDIKCTEFKASDAGLFEGGDYWQTTEGTSNVGTLQNQKALDRQPQIASTESAVWAFWRKVVPDVVEVFSIFPFIRRVSRLFGIDKLWKKVYVC